MHQNVHRYLTSCTVSPNMLRRLETALFAMVPKMLQAELKRMMELLGLSQPGSLKAYRIVIENKTEVLEYTSAKEIKDSDLSPATRNVRVLLNVGKPEVLALAINFPRSGRPHLEVSSLNREVRKKCPKLADQLEGVLATWGNRNSQYNRRVFQVLIALFLPVLFIGVGIWRQADPFFLLSSQGWLLLLSFCQALLLARLYPHVTYATASRINLQRAGALSLFFANGLLLVGYMALVASHLHLLELPFF